MNSLQSPDSFPSGSAEAKLGLVRLPANGTTVAAEELHATLVLAADRAGEIVVDASAVENVGQAVLQLLLAARAEAEARGLDFTIDHPSEPFRARVEACLLAGALGLSPAQEPVR